MTLWPDIMDRQPLSALCSSPEEVCLSTPASMVTPLSDTSDRSAFLNL